jgi:TPR repeat protein
MSNFDMDSLNDYEVKSNDNSDDKWKIYLFELLKGNLRTRLDEMIETSEYKSFFLGLKYEYGFYEQKDLEKALSSYKKGAWANSTDYLSMARLYDIYRKGDKKFNIKRDKNLEFIYLFKSFTYLPLSYLNNDPKKNRCPLNIKHTVLSYLKHNDPEVKKSIDFIDKLKNSGNYDDILSAHDSSLMKGFLEGYFNYSSIDDKLVYLDQLFALSYAGNLEANCRIISIYMKILYQTDITDEKKIQILKSKIYDQFRILEEAKYYKAYGQYGLFLYNEMRMFDVSLNIFKEGYEHNIYECSLYYFNAFTKDDNQSIYNIGKFDRQKFINIFQTLIDTFIYGKIFSLELMFDFFHIIGKHYNLCSELSNKYMKYLDEIAIICLSFIDEKEGEDNMKRYNPYELERIKHSANHALSMIYMYGLTKTVKKNLLKAETCLKAASEFNVYVQPYYTNLIYKIRKKLFKLGVFEDKNDLIQCGNELFQLYNKYKDYKYYGNSFYYIFGKLYEKGIGTIQDDKKAYKYYQKGCSSLVNLNDSFIIVYKRYLCLKIVNSDKFILLFSLSDNNPTFLVRFKLTIGAEIPLQAKNNMTIGDAKNELYKRIELQNLMIKTFLFRGEQIKDQKRIIELKMDNNEAIVVVVEQKKKGVF